MPESTVVRARIDEATKAAAAAILAASGLSLSDAFRMLLKRIAAERALPFEPLAPGAETLQAMTSARAGRLTAAGSPKSLLDSLNTDDAQLAVALQSRATLNGRSAEAEHREILAAALATPRRKTFAEILAAMPNVGRDSDFARIDATADAPRVFD